MGIKAIAKRTRYYVIKLFGNNLFYELKGFLYYLTPQTESMYFNSGEERLMQHMKKYANKKLNFIDVGACVGYISLPASDLYKQVYSFEPVISNKVVLDKNVLANHVSNIKTFPYSLGEKEDVVYFVESYATSRWSENGNLKVNQRAGDQFNFKDVGFIKIDVEGFEHKVLMGLKKTILRDRPVIVLESAGVNLEYVHKIMASYGYRLVEHFEQNELWVTK